MSAAAGAGGRIRHRRGGVGARLRRPADRRAPGRRSVRQRAVGRGPGRVPLAAGDKRTRGCGPRPARPRCTRASSGRAADAYLHLAGEDPTRLAEAAEGLETVARAAERAGRADAMEQAVVGLQAIAPDRVPGRYALRLAQQQGADPEELVNLLPGAIAAASDQVTSRQPARAARAARWSRPPAAVRRCCSIARWFDGRRTARRGRQAAGARRTAPSRWESARSAAGRPADAALWYAEAARTDSTSADRTPCASGLRRRPGGAGRHPGGGAGFQAVAADSTAPDSVVSAARIRLQRIGLNPAGTVPAEPRPETR